jgi:predicted transposase/invertase (TIGR01784 family)
MAIGIDPTVDFACKRVLGSPDHPAITLHFLNSVLQFRPPITEVRILNPTIEKGFDGDKWSLLDILAKDELGRLYDIEVQTTRPVGMRKRLAYYAACLLVEQLESGGDYQDLRAAIGICLLDAIEFRDQVALRHQFQLRSEGGLSLTDCLQIHLFELPKYVPPSDNRVITDPVEQWLYFFCRADRSTASELVRRLPDPVFAEATGVLEMIARNPEDRRLYNERLKMERDERARLLQARLDGCEEGIEKGIEKGEIIGSVKVLQELLDGVSSTSQELLELGMERLIALEAELRQRMNRR